jgi:outer membrane protein insertion porin family
MRNMPLMMGLGWPIHPIALFNGTDLDMSQRFFFAVGGSF